ncbi:MAG: hypothetical protein CVU71_16410 [Deltaproteobacteria bacterium HGW-Deltaproteobacteria-6]|nr:MAG: hypothetical protein CVU71_16410 [Deltaproteobacteria bacterium HGW-Deltaproteobacteria-6]
MTIVIAFMMLILPWTAVAAPESPLSIEQNFQKAKQNYLDKKMDAAAAQIKKSAAFMKKESMKASEKSKAALADSAQELEKLAGDVKKGSVTSVKKMEDAFGRAYHALALDAHARSAESWAKKESVKAGESLDKAATYLERGFAWTGRKIEAGTKNALKKSRELSVKLKAKGRAVADDVGKGLKEAGKEIEQFGKNLPPG